MENALSAAVTFISSLPAAVRAVGVLIVGWLAAALLKMVLSRILRLVRFDGLCDRVGISEFLRKGRVRHLPSDLVGIIAWWTVLLVTLLTIARILDLTVVNSFTARLAAFVPGLLAGVFVGIVGLVIVSFLGNFVMTVARTAGFAHATLLARAVKIAGYIIVLALALQQIDLNRTMIGALFEILFAAVAFGLALAFGLGGKDLARDACTRLIQNLREKGRMDGRSDLEG